LSDLFWNTWHLYSLCLSETIEIHAARETQLIESYKWLRTRIAQTHKLAINTSKQRNSRDVYEARRMWLGYMGNWHRWPRGIRWMHYTFVK
jgi:hypothetical protein